jgi:L-rhamnose-H+ transport protein
MPDVLFGGLFLTLLAGLLSGNCMLPMKFARRWQWENLWLVFSVVSLLILPWGLVLLFVGDPRPIYAGVLPGQLLLTLLLGAGWGVAQVLFGLSVARLGLALGYAIIIGLGSLGGTLVPLFFKNIQWCAHLIRTCGHGGRHRSLGVCRPAARAGTEN